MNLRDTYNTIAQEWHRDHQSDTWWQEGTDIFLSHLKSGARVLDAGCAGGYKTKYIASRGYAVEGIDLSDAFIAIAKREQPNLRFHQMDIRDIEVLPDTYDAIYTSAVLLHFPKNELRTQLEKFNTKLHDQGYLYIAVKGQRPGGVEEEVKTEHDYGYPYERFFSYYTKADLESACVNAGFTIVFSSVVHTGNTDWITVVAQK